MERCEHEVLVNLERVFPGAERRTYNRWKRFLDRVRELKEELREAGQVFDRSDLYRSFHFGRRIAETKLELLQAQDPHQKAVLLARLYLTFFGHALETALHEFMQVRRVDLKKVVAPRSRNEAFDLRVKLGAPKTVTTLLEVGVRRVTGAPGVDEGSRRAPVNLRAHRLAPPPPMPTP